MGHRRSRRGRSRASNPVTLRRRWTDADMQPRHGDVASKPGESTIPVQAMLARPRRMGTCWKCGAPVYGDTGACSVADCMTNDPD